MTHTKRMLENANKFAYLVRAYPEKNVNEIINLFRLSPIDTNCAIWVATELKWIEVEHRQEMQPKFDNKGKQVGEEEVSVPYAKAIGQPGRWEFGDTVKELQDTLKYAFEHINGDENDMEENYLTSWLSGYATQDTLCAVKNLIDKGVLHEYEIEDGENKYIFYTLKVNEGKNWGQKQFKTNPLTGEPNEKSAEAEKSEE